MPASSRIIHDPHEILTDIHKNGSYVTGNHVVCETGNHCAEYPDIDTYLNHSGVGKKVSGLLAQGITPGSIIIGPDTRGSVVLGELVARLAQSRFVATKKVNNVHTFPSEITTLLHGEHPRILIDSILDSSETLEQIQKALQEIGLTVNELRVMMDVNPENSGQLWVPVTSLAQLQIPQWDEKDVPEWLKARPISTKLGKARNWVPKSPGEVIAYKFFLERIHKQDLGFTFDDRMVVKQFDQDGFMLRPAESLAEVVEEAQ